MSKQTCNQETMKVTVRGGDTGKKQDPKASHFRRNKHKNEKH